MFRNKDYRYTRSMVYDYSRVARIQEQRRRKQRSRKFTKLFVILIFSTFLGVIVYRNLYSTTETKFLSPFVGPLAKSVKALNTLVSPGLQATVTNSLSGSNGRYAVVIKNLKTGEEYAQDENDIFWSASLYKLWVMGTVYNQELQAKLSDDDELKANIADLNRKFDIASEEAELTEGSIDLTVSQAMQQMIVISHNYAAMLLTSKVGLSSLDKFLKTYDLTHSHTGSPPVTTAEDIAQFYEKLYKGEIINKEYSDKMLELLKKQQINDRIPALLPDNIDVAHKTGELEGYKHDAGIVFTPQGDYIIVMLSKSNDPQSAAKREAQLSLDVFNYFQK
jgi:beta-lactamase class A